MMYQNINLRQRIALTMKFKILFLAFLVVFFTPLTVSAVVVKGLFEVKIPVLDESETVRRAALNDGLVEVLIRVSGDSNIRDKIVAPAADSYVKRYEYLSQAEKGTKGEPSQQIWVRYNATRILNFLRKQAIPIWGERRNQTVVWLAVSDGRQRYILKNTDVSPLKTKAETILNRRGIPVVWPQLDARDRKNVRFADILVGFTDPVKHASKRYSSGSIVMASLSWNGSEWKGEWTLLMGDETRKWSLNSADYAGLISKAVNLISDTMGEKYAVMEAFDASQHNTIVVEIDRVENVETFRRIEKYLLSLSMVESVQLSHVEPERVFFNLILRSKADDLLNQIKSGTLMFLLADDVTKGAKEKLSALPPKDVVDPKAVNPKDKLVVGKSMETSIVKPDVYRFVLY